MRVPGLVPQSLPGMGISRAGGLHGTKSSASYTFRIHWAARQSGQKQAHEEQNPGRFAGWKMGGVRRNLGNGSNGRFHPPIAAGFGNVQLSVGFVGDGFIAPFHLQRTLEEVLGTKTLKSSS